MDTPKHNTGHFIALQREEIPLHPPKHRCKLPQLGNLDKPLVQLHPQGAGSTIKKNHNFQPTERTSQTQQSKQNEKAEKYSAGKGT